MPNRYTGGSKYRYSFNGMEKDNEIKGDGNSLSTHFRQYDSRIARWTSIDPVTHHHMSPYNAFDGNPIYFADPSGADSESDGEYVEAADGTRTKISDKGDDEGIDIIYKGGEWKDDGTGYSGGTSTVERTDEFNRVSTDVYNSVTVGNITLFTNSTWAWDVFKTGKLGIYGVDQNYLLNSILNGERDLIKMLVEKNQPVDPLDVLANNIYDNAGDFWGSALLSVFPPGEDASHVENSLYLVGIVTMRPGRSPNRPRGGRMQKHHIIPNQVYKEFASDLKFWNQNHAFNLKKLPTPFHANHPSYNKYVRARITELQRTNSLDLQNMINLQQELRMEINSIYLDTDFYRLNDYYKYAK